VKTYLSGGTTMERLAISAFPAVVSLAVATTLLTLMAL
jgi:hypothetical protein